ncbi:MAG: hypothetical protein ABIR18_04595 [Chitinophagaceae bacterium]
MSKKKKKGGGKPVAGINAIISDKVGNYENDPFFIKKAEDAKAFLKKAGFPKQLRKELKGFNE